MSTTVALTGTYTVRWLIESRPPSRIPEGASKIPYGLGMAVGASDPQRISAGRRRCWAGSSYSRAPR